MENQIFERKSPSDPHAFHISIFLKLELIKNCALIGKWVLNGNYNLTHTLFSSQSVWKILELMQTEGCDRKSHVEEGWTNWNSCKLIFNQKADFELKLQSDPHAYLISTFFEIFWNWCKVSFEWKSLSDPHAFHISIFSKWFWNWCKVSFDRKVSCGHTSQCHPHAFLTHMFFSSQFFERFWNWCKVSFEWKSQSDSHAFHISIFFKIGLELMQTELWSESELWIEITIWPTRFSEGSWRKLERSWKRQKEAEKDRRNPKETEKGVGEIQGSTKKRQKEA